MTRTAAALFAFALFTGPAAAQNPRERWIDSFDEAVAAARKQDKPIFLVFRCER